VRFYERREIQDVLAYLRLISNPRDMAAFERVVNFPRRGIGPTSLGRLKEWAAERGISLLAAAGAASEVPDLPAAASRGLALFARLVAEFAARAKRLAVGPLIEELVDALDLVTALRAEGPEGADRMENVKELIAGAMEFEAQVREEWEGSPPEHFTELDLFLQQVALVTDIDRHDPAGDAVTLMTLHNAKGLEYGSVTIAGLEEGLFPLARAYDDPAQLEEERRLFYVGITRARDRLCMTWARERRRAGGYMAGSLSSFVEDVPEALLDSRVSPRVEREDAAYRTRADSSFRTREEDGFERAARASTRRALEERVFEEELNQDLPTLRPGERVSHATFGSGKVVDVVGFGDDLKVTVDFESVGRKRLLARYAGLERDF
jgi:DNA helicase-2/ATP-dependent DNA helicase PcrA